MNVLKSYAFKDTKSKIVSSYQNNINKIKFHKLIVMKNEVDFYT